MKTHYTVALSMLAGIGLGAVGVPGLHAQAKPPVYLITEIDVTDPENYGKEFAPRAQATIRNAGARFIVIGGVGGRSKASACHRRHTPEAACDPDWGEHGCGESLV